MKTKLTTTKTLLSLSILAANFAVQAQQKQELETITVTATRTEQPLSATLSSITVIDREDIDAIQPLSTVELLSQVAGLDVSQQGGRGQLASVFMRGTNSNHTLVLVDGIRIGSATLGTSDIQSIAPAQIERIEIVKGPKAAIWGSDAIGGVIQIFTRKSEGLQAEGNVGSEGYKQISATIGFEHGDGSSSITISREEADGFDVLQGVQEDEDGFEHISFTASGEQRINKQLQLTYLLQANESDDEYDNAWFGNDQVETENYAWFVGANYQWTNNDLLSVKLGQNQDSDLNYGTGEAGESLFETNRDQLSIVNHRSLDAETSVALGLDYNSESITTTVTEFSPAYNATDRDLIGLFVYGEKSIDNVKLEAAVRYDDVESIDSEITYNLGAGYDFSENTKLAINHSTGFKAPTFNDLYSPFGGNPDLESEQSETTEILLKHYFGLGNLGLSVYQTEVDNLIAWAPQVDGSWKPDNVNEADIQGAEFELSVNHAGLRHNLSLAYIDTEDKKTNKQLIRRAREHFNYSVAAQMGEIDFAVNYSYKGERTDSNDVKLDSYSLVNAKLGYAISDAIKLNFKVSNLFDESYTTANGYNTQGQTFYFGVSYQH